MRTDGMNQSIQSRGLPGWGKVIVILCVMAVAAFVGGNLIVKTAASRLGSSSREKILNNALDRHVTDIIERAGFNRSDFDISYGDPPGGIIITNKKDNKPISFDAFFYRMPPGFPQLTVPSGSHLTGSMMIGKRILLGLEVDSSKEDQSRDLFFQGLKSKDWKENTVPNMSPDYNLHTFTKEIGTLEVTFTPLPSKGKTSIVLSFAPAS